RQPMNPELVNMNAVVESAWEDVRPVPGRQIELKVNQLPDVRGDRVLLEQIWTQLIENAVKFTAPRKKAVIEINGKVEPDRIVYSIKDNGVGFNMKSAGKLFGVFQRMHTEQEFEGSGIGLAIVQRLVRRHSGEAWTEAEPEQGAT